jgi:predicted PurR-regulated permease PerM
MILGGNNAGIGLLLYGAIIVSWIDNIIRPYFVGKRAKMSEAIILIGMLGGLNLFGAIGLIIGPLVLDYLTIFIEFYRTKKMTELI